jgi:class 3 adenylate cyclase
VRQSIKIHAVVYAAVNLFLVAIWALTGGGYFWPIWVILGWGLGLACHAAPLLAGVGRRARPASQPEHAGRPAPPHAGTSVDDVATSIGEERPSLRPIAAPDGTVTMLFSDIESSTEVNERLGDVRWLELLRLHHAIVRDQVRAHDGYEVKSQGDGFMIAFARAVDERLGSHPDGPIRLRMGLHTGEAIREEADFYGKNVVLAARITDEAKGGEILASAVVKQLTESAGDVGFADERTLQLNGLTGTHTVYRVV